MPSCRDCAGVVLVLQKSVIPNNPSGHRHVPIWLQLALNQVALRKNPFALHAAVAE
jgi:hypothetical protein